MTTISKNCAAARAAVKRQSAGVTKSGTAAKAHKASVSSRQICSSFLVKFLFAAIFIMPFNTYLYFH